MARKTASFKHWNLATSIITKIRKFYEHTRKQILKRGTAGCALPKKENGKEVGKLDSPVQIISTF